MTPNGEDNQIVLKLYISDGNCMLEQPSTQQQKMLKQGMPLKYVSKTKRAKLDSWLQSSQKPMNSLKSEY